MRLTLRTLIAWLDDTLTPGEVREIGHQVAESPFAKELVERVHRVTRQRRLTVPGSSGSESTDPNIVASYLDNQLPGDEVAEFEKKCLTSDVHLAEVASVHQVLSLIGHKAKVPTDARNRMYRLIKGREASAAKPTPAPARPSRPHAEPAPITPHLGSWIDTLPPRRSRLERYGPAVGVLFLIGLSAIAAVNSLKPEPHRPPVAFNFPGRPKAEPKDQAPLPIEANNPATPQPEPAKADPKPEEPKPAELPPDEVGSFDSIQGIVLRARAEGNAVAWDRAEPKAAFKGQARLINLAPFRNTLKLRDSEAELVDSTEVVLDPIEKDGGDRIELKRGQLVIRPLKPNAAVSVRFEGQVLAINASAGTNVGIERNPSLVPGQAEPPPARLRVYVPSGKVKLKAGDAEETLEGPAEVSLQASGRFGSKGRQSPPAWVSDATPSAFDKEVGDTFTNAFRPGRPILADLVEALDDPEPKVRRLAVLALGSIGDMESVASGLERKGDPGVHRAVVEVLRSGLARGGDSARSVHDALVRQFEVMWGEVTESLLVGYRPEEVKDEATMVKLVEYLSTAPSRATRELALDNLRALTNRDTLEYDPDAPEGKGLKAWQDLVRKKEITKEARPGGGIR